MNKNCRYSATRPTSIKVTWASKIKIKEENWIFNKHTNRYMWGDWVSEGLSIAVLSTQRVIAEARPRMTVQLPTVSQMPELALSLSLSISLSIYKDGVDMCRSMREHGWTWMMCKTIWKRITHQVAKQIDDANHESSWPRLSWCHDPNGGPSVVRCSVLPGKLCGTSISTPGP